MDGKKYSFELTAKEIIILNNALSWAGEVIEYIDQKETLESLKKRFQKRVDKIFDISAKNIPGK